MKSMLTFAMVATGQEMIKEKKFFKVREKTVNFTEFHGLLSKKSGRNEILRVHIYSFPSTFIVFIVSNI